MPKLDIIIPGPEIESDPDATALWDQTGNFISTALARMERGKAFPAPARAMPGLRCRECAQGDHAHDGVGAIRGALDSNDVVFARLTASGCCFSRGNIVSSNYWLMS
jgi:hypothetical protein